MIRWNAAPAVLIAVITVATAPAAAPPTYGVTMRFAGGLPPETVGPGVYGYDRHYNWLASEYVTRALAQEFAEHNINVNCVAPGPVNTERSTPLTFDMKQIPSGRFAEISEVTALIRLLCGAQGRYITGQTIHVNGGFYINN